MSHRRRLLRAALGAGLVGVIALAASGCALATLSDSVDRAVDRVREQRADSGGPEAPDTGPDDELESDADGESDEGNTPIDEIRVGDCLNDEEVSLDEDITAILSLDVVPCDGPHDSEVYGLATFDLETFPGDDELDELTDEQCFALFEPFVGLDYQSSTLDYTFYSPTAIGWKYGDRDALCVLYDVELGSLVGSARDQGI